MPGLKASGKRAWPASTSSTHAQGLLTPAERVEIERLPHEADPIVLRKTHATALLRWRGHAVASP
ncbi:hypothetical protein [Sorangium cellulosum]|uniref:hypothetical protein n=1 Tax=Sorangium cellulosum TaxID=56 RepID=UPI001331B0BC|nr:hypothetical protein [Sorangium cellulosum]